MTKNKIIILFIEDDDLLRSLFSEALSIDTEYQYEILSATDLKTGLEKVKTGNPNLIMLDLILPFDKTKTQDILSEKMGISLLKEIKKDPNTKEVPVIIFSNISDIEIRKQTLDAGANEYLIKSETTPEKFLKVIKTILQKKTG